MAKTKTDPILTQMFQFCGVEQEEFQKALKKIGPEKLIPFARKLWNKENPTTNPSYVIADFVFNYIAPKNSVPFRLDRPWTDEQYYFVKWPNGAVVDLAKGSLVFPDDEYSTAKKAKFQSPSPCPSARELADILKIED